MARICEYEAEIALREWGYDAVNSDETICSAIAESYATFFGPGDIEVFVWRSAGGIPEFMAIMTLDGDSEGRWVHGNEITIRIRGAFHERKRGQLSVRDYVIEDCRIGHRRRIATS